MKCRVPKCEDPAAHPKTGLCAAHNHEFMARPCGKRFKRGVGRAAALQMFLREAQVVETKPEEEKTP